MDLAAWELWRMTNFAYDAQGRPAVFLDENGNLCVANPDWCISGGDGATKTPGFLAWVWTSNPRVALVVAGTSGSSGPGYDLRPMGYEMTDGAGKQWKRPR